MLLPAAISYQRKKQVVFIQQCFTGAKHKLLFQLLKVHFAKHVTHLVIWKNGTNNVVVFSFFLKKKQVLTFNLESLMIHFGSSHSMILYITRCTTQWRCRLVRYVTNWKPVIAEPVVTQFSLLKPIKEVWVFSFLFFFFFSPHVGFQLRA